MMFDIPPEFPRAWIWKVGDLPGFWSAELGSYVDELPEGWSLDGERLRPTRIISEADLTDVLANYGLPGPLVTIDHVKAEAQRRIIVVTGATDLQGCLIKQLNANMRANELNDIRVSGGTLTPQEEAQADALRALALVIKGIRTKSNEIEALDPIPHDFKSDSYWSD